MRPLAAGLVVGFAACVALGWIASAHSPYRNFVRLHQLLSPESLYYPTVSQLLALVRASVPEGKVAVIVGGSSVLNGVGQTTEQIWTRRLQEQLGEPYRVVNLALRAGWYTEGGALVAEHLVKSGVSVILVGDIHVDAAHTTYALHEYMFWDAYYKGMLLDDPGRDARLRQMRAALTAATRERHDDGRLGARLDAVLRFNDLWTYLAYERVFSVWTQLASPTPFRARRWYADNTPGQSPAQLSTRPSPGDEWVASLGRHLSAFVRVDGRGNVVADPALPTWRSVADIAGSSMPLVIRQRTVLLVRYFAARDLALLSRQERVAFDVALQQTAAVHRAAGYHAVALSAFLDDDYVDRQHLSPSGGAKLADEAAPAIRELARRLGYVP